MIDIICGGQAGDEGKGKIASYLSYTGDYAYSVRIGGPNAGHTVVLNGVKYALKNIPSGFVNPKTKVVLGAGAYTKTEWLLEEMKKTGVEDRLIIDPNVVLIDERQTKAEKEDPHFMQNIGSVGTGLGQAIKERIERRDIKFAKDEPLLAPYVKDVYEVLNKATSKGEKVLIEGTQGMKLSLLHGEYPFVTTRDSTASTFLGEAGVGPKYVNDVFLIFKPYVSRVGPGPLENEITDEKELERYRTKGHEVGTVGKRLRRIGRFEMEMAKRAVMINSATKIAITHIDLFEGNDAGTIKTVNDFSPEAKAFLKKMKELETVYPNPKVALISNGPDVLDMVGNAD